ncbi:hypothetical protein K466DRAFT_607013 [Polyporus arcularius HHB13444]|uniref:C2H2-type domain-containing protein n=1 Tax=Polyporus arcularius HHB13444 TaxID=1314778 RepID=A0A5C3NPX3_9APHY|nr:hypothetical protein K466DRAFT_607013 [Polyporus arcularius HHB13444]
MLNNDKPYAHDCSMFPPDLSPDNPATIPSTSGAVPDPWPYWAGDYPTTTLDGAAALTLSDDQFEAWRELCAVPTIPDISTPSPSATPATSRDTPSKCSLSTPPTSAVPFCVSPADTIFSVVPSLSSPSTTASPDSLGHLSPTTPHLPSIPIPVKAVTLVTAPASGLPPPTHLPTGFLALELLETRPNVAPGPPLYIPVYTMPCTASATSIVPPPSHITPAVSEMSPVDVALPPGSSRRPRRTRSRSVQSKSAGQTATKLFKCPIPECGAVIMNRVWNYYQHMREQHDPTFQRANCPHCPCSYTRSSELNRHKIKNHPSSITEDIHGVTVNPPI